MAASVQRRQSVRRQLAELAQWLEADDDERLEVFGSSDQDEWLLRLVGMALALTTQHQADKQGRCQQRRELQVGWRRWWPRWAKPTPCRVERVAQLFAVTTLDVVWWRVFQLVGDQRSIDDVRDWLAAEATTAVLPRVEDEGGETAGDEHALLSDARVLLRLDETAEGEYGRHSLDGANVGAVSVPELVERAMEQHEALRLAWPEVDPDEPVVWAG